MKEIAPLNLPNIQPAPLPGSLPICRIALTPDLHTNEQYQGNLTASEIQEFIQWHELDLCNEIKWGRYQLCLPEWRARASNIFRGEKRPHG